MLLMDALSQLCFESLYFEFDEAENRRNGNRTERYSATVV